MPDFQPLMDNVLRHISLTGEERHYFVSLLRTRSVPAKSFLLKQGEDCLYIYYVKEGALRAFYTAPNDKESTVMFALADWWITDMFRFLNNRPALMNIEVSTGSCPDNPETAGFLPGHQPRISEYDKKEKIRWNLRYFNPASGGNSFFC